MRNWVSMLLAAGMFGVTHLLHAAVVVEYGAEESESNPQSIINKTIESVLPEEAMANPSSFLPETFKLDLGREQGEKMNPLVRNFYNKISRRDVDGALEVLEDLKETQYLNPKLYTTQAQLLIFQKKFDAARAAVRQALRYDQSYMRAHKMLAFVNMLDGEVDTAIKDLLASLEYDEKDTEVLKMAAFGFLNKQDMKGATRIFAYIVQLTPKVAQAHADLGNAWLRAGEIRSALLALQEATRLEPKSATRANEYGTALVAAGKYNEALAAYAAALQHDPFYSPSISNMGVLVYTDGQVQNGIRLLVKACDTDITSNLAWNNLVLVLARHFPILPGHTTGRQDHGKYMLTPDRMLYQWGLELAAQGRTDAAIRHLVKAMQENPGNPQYINDLGGLFASSGGIKMAKVMFQRALVLLPGYTDARKNLHTVERQLGVLNKAQAATTATAPRHRPLDSVPPVRRP